MTRIPHDRSLRRDERGAARADALIVAVFFTLVFAAIMFMHRVHYNPIEVARRTRACAWAEVRRLCAQEGIPAQHQRTVLQIARDAICGIVGEDFDGC
jgi:hypothetical protein